MTDLNDARDPITGLFNRAFLDDLLPREISRARRRASSIGLAALRLDIQPTAEGSAQKPGELLLWEFGYLLRLSLRAEDTACRTDASEFVIVLPGMPPSTLACRVVELRSTLERYYAERRPIKRGQPVITLAIASFPEGGVTPAALLQTLQAALERARIASGITGPAASSLDVAG